MSLSQRFALSLVLLITICARAADTDALPGDLLAKSWAMPKLDISSEIDSNLHEEELIGHPEIHRFQPRWTARRRFATTHIYVQPEGEINLEQWIIVTSPHDGDTNYSAKTELEFGLPYRTQIDVYQIVRRDSRHGRTSLDQAVEVRYALGAWDEYPGNPTLYYEWIHRDRAADAFEAMILFGGELASRWHWGTDIGWEQDVGEARDGGPVMSNGLSYTLFDEKLQIGFEDKLGVANTHGNRSGWTENLRLGPSIQWRPTPRMHIDFVPLFGLTRNSSNAEVYLVLGLGF